MCNGAAPVSNNVLTVAWQVVPLVEHRKG